MTNVFDPETWGSPGGPDTLGGHFFRLFFGVGSGSEPVPGPGHPGRGEGGSWIGESRSVTATLASTANGFAETRHRSSSRSSLALDRIPIADRVRAELASNLARSASTWHKDRPRINPITDRSSQHLLTIFDRSERSRTSFDARGNFPRARSISDRCAIGPTSQARTHSLARMSEAAPIDPDRSPIPASARKKFPRIASTNERDRTIFFRSFDRKKRVSVGPLTPLPTKSSRERFFSVGPLTPRIPTFHHGATNPCRCCVAATLNTCQVFTGRVRSFSCNKLHEKARNLSARS